MRLHLAVAAVCFSIGSASGQEAPAIPDDAVVAVINGGKMTAGEVRRMIAALPAQAKQMFERDPKQVLQQHAVYLTFQRYAEEQGLDKISPYRETLEFYRMSVLNQAAVNQKQQEIRVGPEEQQEYYDKNKNDFREAKVRMIYYPFTGAAAALAEGEAKAKAAAAVKRLRSGEDVAKVAEATSGQAPADVLTVTPASSQPPAHMREVILRSMTGSVTDPLRHENGYYVFRVESAGILPYERVRDDIFKTIRDARFAKWMEQMRSKASVQFENEAFFNNIGKGK